MTLVSTELLFAIYSDVVSFLLLQHTIQQQAVVKNLKSSLPSIEKLEGELSRGGEGGDE